MLFSILTNLGFKVTGPTTSAVRAHVWQEGRVAGIRPEKRASSWLNTPLLEGKRLPLHQRNVLAEDMSSNLKSDYKQYIVRNSH